MLQRNQNRNISYLVPFPTWNIKIFIKIYQLLGVVLNFLSLALSEKKQDLELEEGVLIINRFRHDLLFLKIDVEIFVIYTYNNPSMGTKWYYNFDLKSASTRKE